MNHTGEAHRGLLCFFPSHASVELRVYLGQALDWSGPATGILSQKYSVAECHEEAARLLR